MSRIVAETELPVDLSAFAAVDTAYPVEITRCYDALRPCDISSGRRERRVDRLDLVGMDRSLRGKAVAKRLDAGLAIIDKRRPGPNEVAEMRIIGDVEGRSAILVDDIVDTAGTIVTAAAALRKAGARRVIGCCTHGVLSGPAIERLRSSAIEELVVTDTIPVRPEAQKSGKVNVRSVAHLLAEAIRRTHDEESISSLFLS